MATMVGVQRSGITAALREVERGGLISSRPGLVTTLNVSALMALPLEGIEHLRGNIDLFNNTPGGADVPLQKNSRSRLAPRV